MKGAKIGLLLVILAFGSTVETAWRIRNHFGPGAWGWFTSGHFQGPSFSFEAQQTEVVAASTPVEVENAFGTVNVSAGAPGEVRITLRKVVYLGAQEKARAFADRIQLQAVREGGALRIRTNRADLDHRPTDGDSEADFQTHLDVLVPPGTAVKVQNEHGAVAVTDVARADVSASFETVRVERVAGPADIEARHGDVHVTGIKGDLKLTNRHGDVTIEDVDGKATLDVQHGEVSATRVGGLVVNGAHGDVTAESVKGDLDVHTQHGAVRGTDVTGRASVETSFEGVTLEKVGGDATVHTEHGEVSLSDVTGAVDAQASFGRVLTHVGGRGRWPSARRCARAGSKGRPRERLRGRDRDRGLPRPHRRGGGAGDGAPGARGRDRRARPRLRHARSDRARRSRGQPHRRAGQRGAGRSHDGRAWAQHNPDQRGPADGHARRRRHRGRAEHESRRRPPARRGRRRAEDSVVRRDRCARRRSRQDAAFDSTRAAGRHRDFARRRAEKVVENSLLRSRLRFQ
jgi:hypothetical protein